MQVNTMTIEITNFDNAAMQDDRSGEVVRMLQGLIASITDYGLPNADGKRLMDSNGNQVGTVSVDWNDDDEDDETALDDGDDG